MQPGRIMRAFRYVAALVALVVFAHTAHWTLVAHSVCAAHGELTHHQHGDADHRDHVAERAGHHEVAPATADEDHDHCLGVWTEQAVLTDAAPAEMVLLESHEVVGIRASSILFATRRWMLAPKTSPPSSLSS